MASRLAEKVEAIAIESELATGRGSQAITIAAGSDTAVRESEVESTVES